MNKLEILKKYYDGSVIENDSSKNIGYLESEGLLKTKVTHRNGKIVIYAYTTPFGKKLMKHNLIIR